MDGNAYLADAIKRFREALLERWSGGYAYLFNARMMKRPSGL